MEIAKYAAMLWVLPIAIAASIWRATGNLLRPWRKALIRSLIITLVFPLPVQLPLGGSPTAILPGYYSWIGVFYIVPAILVSLILWAVLFCVLFYVYSE